MSQYRQEKIMRAFCSDLTATQAAQMLGLNRNTINRYYGAFRRAIFAWQEEQKATFTGTVEVDESYFGSTRPRGSTVKLKRGRGTMKQPVYPEHVGALNLIEVEFAKDKKVLACLNDLFSHFGTEHNRRKTEKIYDKTGHNEVLDKDKEFYERLSQERQRLLAKLLHSMATSLKFKIEQLEIFEGGYTPQGWSEIEHEQQAVRRLLVDIYLGKRSFPIAVVDYTQANNLEKDQTQSNI